MARAEFTKQVKREVLKRSGGKCEAVGRFYGLGPTQRCMTALTNGVDLRKSVERQLSAQRGIVTRIKNRVGHGVCPCCSQTFQYLQRHMKMEHSDYAKSELQAAE